MAHRYQFVCIAEHKKLEADIPDEQAKFVQLGFKSWWSQARATPEGGVSGGTSVHAHRCFMARRLDWSSLPKGRYLPAEPMNWTAILVRGYVNVIVVTAYFKDGIGMVAENVAMMADIAGWLLAAGLPWLIVADWNTTPELLLQSGVLDGLEAVVLAPRDCSATCSMGSGRLIDFAVASKSMAPAILVEADYMAPVRPHVALRVHLNLKLFDDMIRVQAVPPAPRVPAISKAQHRALCGIPEDASAQAKRRKLPRKGSQSTTKRSTDPPTDDLQEDQSDVPEVQQAVSWAEARQVARAMVRPGLQAAQHRPSNARQAIEDSGGVTEHLKGDDAFDEASAVSVARSLVTDSFAFILSKSQALRLGARYGATITTAEVYLAAKDPSLDSRLQLAVGRAKGPRYKTRAVKDVLGCKGPLETAGASHELRLWAVVASKLNLLVKLQRHEGPLALTQASDIRLIVAQSIVEIGRMAQSDGGLELLQEAEEWQLFAKNWALHESADFLTWAAKANDVLELKLREAAQQAKRQFIRWQDDQVADHHAKGIYAWVKKAGRELCDGDVVHLGQVAVSNEDSANARAEPWGDLWQVLEETPQQFAAGLCAAWEELCVAMKAESLPERTMAHFHEALYTFDANTGRGSDNIGPNFIKALPMEAKGELLALFNDILLTGAWPWQWLHTIICLIPKPTGGDRPIGLSPMLMRLFFRCFADVTRGWTMEKHGAWDTAIKGSSSLRAALKRALDIECAQAADEIFALILLDIEKFFDSIPLPVLIRAGLRLGYPAALMALNVLACLALRTLKSNSGAAKELQAYRSIVAGLGEACNLARIIIYKVCEDYTAQFPSVPLKTFVDDMAQFTHGPSYQVARDAMLAGRALAVGIMSEGFVISKKSQLLTNCERTKHLVSSTLTGVGVHINCVDKAVDLGIDVSASAERAGAKRAARVKLAFAKAERITRLHRRHVRLNMVKTVVVSQASYGTEAVGIRPSEAMALKRKITAMLGLKQGMCSATLLAIHREQQPVASIRWRQLKEWISLWVDNPQDHDKIRVTWNKTFHVLRQQESTAARWSLVNGPVAGLIATLIDIGWNPKKPDVWFTQEGTMWWMTRDPMDMLQIRNEFLQLSELADWRAAARHHLGTGMEGGVHVVPLLKLRRKLKREGLIVQVGLLDAIATAGLWTDHRCKEAGYSISSVCKFCGQSDDTEEHRLWGCKVIMDSDDPDIARSNHLAKYAQRLADDGSGETMAQRAQCFWLRGLIPRSWITEDPTPAQRIWASGICQQELWDAEARSVYIDESAGAFSSNEVLRRCGWGFVILSEDNTVLGAVSGTQPGTEQTQNAAVLTGIEYMLKHSVGDICVRPDSNMAVDGLRRVLRGELSQFGPHAHSWHAISRALEARHGAVTVERVDAHADVDDYIEHGYPVQDWIGNEVADYLAGEAARANGPSLQRITDWDFFCGRATLILKRAMVVHRLYLGPAGATTGPRGVWRQTEHPVHQAIRLSGHQLCRDSRGAFQCLACGQRAGRRSLKEWLATGRCPALHEVAQDQLLALDQEATGSVMIGTRMTDRTHSLVWKRGVWLCTSCGGYAKATLDAKSTCVKLVAPCRPPTSSGTGVLRRFGRGDTPKVGMQWPMPDYYAAERQADPMHVLWPDMRKGSEARRKRKAVDDRPQEDSPDGPSSSAAGPVRAVVARTEEAHDSFGAGCQFFDVADDEEQDPDPWGDQAQHGLDTDEEV